MDRAKNSIYRGFRFTECWNNRGKKIRESRELELKRGEQLYESHLFIDI